MKKVLPLILIVCAIIIGSVFVGGFLLSKQSDNKVKEPATPSMTSNTDPDNESTDIKENNKSEAYSIDQVSQHSSPNNCWIIIQKNVYNVTSFINQHPGGSDRIIPYCGNDASEAFATQGGEGSHSQDAKNTLAQFLIGKLN